jgi:hypothetical protein
VRVKGALHIHSELSRDGTMTIPELVQWYRGKGYHFLAMGEHAEDLDEAKIHTLREQSADNSSHEFCVIPGIEVACRDEVHLHGIGAMRLCIGQDPQGVIRALREQKAFVVLAHPKRFRWMCDPQILREVDAVEIWNVNYDGKYFPSPRARDAFRRMSQVNPKLRAVASHDFHRVGSFFDVAIEMNVPSLSQEEVVRNLREGSYKIVSLFFRGDPSARVSWATKFSTPLLSWLIPKLRKAKYFLVPSSS